MKEITLVFNTLTWSGITTIPGLVKNNTEAGGFSLVYHPEDIHEDTGLKLTLSALTMNANIKVILAGVEFMYCANSAGIFEKRFVIPAGEKIVLEEK